ncbi:MAG: DUF2306 domain-containing protein [Paracoccaceae bacterium]
MSLDPLLSAPLEVQVHAVAGMIALLLGPAALYRQRRDRWHKVIGYTWGLSILVAALSSFLITGLSLIGPFSPIHLLSIYALWSIWVGLRSIRIGNIARHRGWMTGFYWHGVVIAASFTFLPGRILNETLFPQSPSLGYIIIASGLAAIGLQAILARRNTTRASITKTTFFA